MIKEETQTLENWLRKRRNWIRSVGSLRTIDNDNRTFPKAIGQS